MSALRFPVRPAPLWDRAFLTTAALAFGAVWLLWPLWGTHLPPGPVSAATLRLLGALALGFVVAWVMTRSHRRPGDAIDLTEDELRLPPAISGGAAIRLRFDQVRRVELQGVNNRLRLVLATQAGRQVVPADRMVTPDDFLDLLNALLALAERVPAPERMRLLATVEMALRAPPAPRPTTTYTLIGLCLVVGAYAEWGLRGGPPNAGTEALLFGGNQPVLVREGQWFRLITANYLHGGIAHLAMNMMSLFAVGSALERMLGRRALLALYLFSGITGALGSDAFATARWSVGASTSLFGLVGALGVVHWRNRHTTPAHLLPTGDFWRNTLFMNALLIIAAPNIDHLGHAGGLVGGALLAWALDVRPFQPDQRPHRRLTVVATLLGVVHAVGLAIAFSRPAEVRQADLQRWMAVREAERAPR